MKTRKFGLLGLTVGMALLAACESPAPTVVIPPDSIIPVLTLLPATAQINATAPGNTVQLVAVVTGITSQAATFTSANTSIATVNATGLVTAVAPGIVVITAVSSVDARARAGSTITVVSSGPVVPPIVPTIFIKSITQGGTLFPVNVQNVAGQIDVTLVIDVAPGVVIQRVETLVDGTVMCTQTFSGTGEIDIDAAMAPVEIVCSINTAAFNATTGAPTFPNGPHTISARVVMPTGTISATTQTQLIFNNVSFISAGIVGANGVRTVEFFAPGTTTAKPCVTAGDDDRSIGGAGSLWCGGDVRVNLTTVNFGPSTEGVARATVTLTTSGLGSSGQSTCRATTGQATGLHDSELDPTIAVNDGGAGPTSTGDADFPGCPSFSSTKEDITPADGLTVTFLAGDNPGGSSNGVAGVEDIVTITINTVTTGGQAGPTCINPDPARNPAGVCGTGGFGGSGPNAAFFFNPIRLDNLAPRVVFFDLSPDVCNNPGTGPCFVNGAFAFDADDDDFFVAVDYGADSQNTLTTFSAGAATTSLVAVTTGATLNETLSPTELFLQSQVRDGLANVRNVYPTSDDEIVTTSATEPTLLKFGIDKTAPVIDQATTDANSPPNNGANDGLSYSITFRDDPGPNAAAAGFGAAPVRAKVERITPTALTCRHPETGASISCTTNSGFVFVGGTFNVGGSTTEAYYRVTYSVRDAANNSTATIVRLTLLDVTAPVAGGVGGPSILTGASSATFSAQVTDNIDLGDVTPIVSYGAVAHLQEARATIGTYGPDAFTTSATAAATVSNFIRSIAAAPNTVGTRADFVTFQVRDAAGVVDNDPCPALAAGNVSTVNCVQRRDDISASVAAGITASNPETGIVVTTFAMTVNNATVCNGTTQAGGPAPQPCPTNPTSTTATITATLPTTPGTNPFSRVNLYYTPGASSTTRALLIGTAFGASVCDSGPAGGGCGGLPANTRQLTWSVTWTPAGLTAGAYNLYAVGVDSRGQGLKTADVAVTVAVD